jgi:hypothetical protein
VAISSGLYRETAINDLAVRELGELAVPDRGRRCTAQA